MRVMYVIVCNFLIVELLLNFIYIYKINSFLIIKIYLRFTYCIIKIYI